MEHFGAERSRLFGVAYRMLGSPAEAEDAVQEAWIRWDGADKSVIDNPAAWLTTVTTRLCIDRLRSLTAKREDYVGPWLPEPVSVTPTPEDLSEIDESLTIGFLTVLERLGPIDRAVFLLHDIFDHTYAEVARIVDKTEENCRQIASRARRRVRKDRPPLTTDQRHARELLNSFLLALASGDADQLESLLAEDVVLVSDGGATTRAARHPIITRSRVARLMANLSRRVDAVAAITMVDLNGQPAVLASVAGEAIWLFTIDTDGAGRVRRIWTIRNPQKLKLAAQAL